MTFSDRQSGELSKKLSPRHVKSREQNGAVLSYVEGWHVIAEANRIFGYDAWDRQTAQVACVWEGTRRGLDIASYTARVRVQVRAGGTIVSRDGCGAGHGSGLSKGEAHEIAMKAAETDATKRALCTFGNPFGLALYDKEKRGVRGRVEKSKLAPDQASWRVLLPPGVSASVGASPTEFCSTVRRILEKIDNPEKLEAFWALNTGSIVRLDRADPDLRTEGGRHFGDVLKIIYQKRRRDLGRVKKSREAQSTNGKPVSPIDKSKLFLGECKRERDKGHLRRVAGLSCLVCAGKPCQAHHITFSQPRVMARKVGDQWVVPLCSTHHEELHKSGNEKSWWRDKGIDPVEMARKLWEERDADSGTSRSDKSNTGTSVSAALPKPSNGQHPGRRGRPPL